MGTAIRQLLSFPISRETSGDIGRLNHPSTYRARQLYKNISMLFLFPVPDVI